MPKKILVVDDEESIVKLVSSVLQGNEYEIFTASNGQEGLKKVAEHDPDLIILDINMPLMDGSSMAAAIKEHHDKEIPIIFLTGIIQDGEVQQKPPEETDRFYLTKPFSPLELISSVQRMLNK
jgi:CheY-like chemotaxis protein